MTYLFEYIYLPSDPFLHCYISEPQKLEAMLENLCENFAFPIVSKHEHLDTKEFTYTSSFFPESLKACVYIYIYIEPTVFRWLF